MDGVVLDGQPIAVAVNTVVPLPDVGWAILLQEAVVPLKSGARAPRSSDSGST